MRNLFTYTHEVGIEDDNARVRAEWRGRVETHGGWRKTLSHAGGLFDVDQNGEAGGFFVELHELAGRRAYLKPIKRHDWRRAAREKIAADFAFDLDVNVPPVLLGINEDARAERHVSVSLVMYPQQFSWGQLEVHMGSGAAPFLEVERRLPAAAARAFAFDTWLGQTDHQKPSNIVFGYVSDHYASGSFVFLDYAFSMGISGAWKHAGPSSCDAATFPEYMTTQLDRNVLRETIEKIEGFEETQIRAVVERVPWQWLPDDEKQTISAGLLARRAMVRSALKGYWTEA